MFGSPRKWNDPPSPLRYIAGEEGSFKVMEQRLPVEQTHYTAIAVSWYASVVLGGLAAYFVLTNTMSSQATGLELGLAIGGVVLIVLAVVAPAVVGLVLKTMHDPATGMTVSAVAALGHILLVGGPLVLATPVAARYLAVHRHRSGGY